MQKLNPKLRDILRERENLQGGPLTLFEDIEQEVASYIGTKHAVVCSSGRTALLLALFALRVGHGDEVVIPDFVDQIVPVTVFCSGATPKPCDINRNTLAISSESFSKMVRSKTKAVIFVHLYGYSVDPSPLLEEASRKGVAFVDDAAQALGASVNQKKVGSFGDVGITTFNKSLNVFLGGALTTDNEELASRARMIRKRYESRSFFAELGGKMMKGLGVQSPGAMRMSFLGDNYIHKLKHISLARKHFEKIGTWIEPDQRTLVLWQSNQITTDIANQLMMAGGLYLHKRKLEEVEVSVLRDELRKSDEYLRNRKDMAETYDKALKETCFRRMQVPAQCVPSYLRYPILFKRKTELHMVARELARAKVKIDGRYGSLHNAPFFIRQNVGSDFEESSFVSGHVLPLPVKQVVSVRKVEQVASLINSVSSVHHE
jgi:dTDP-4-amino-4,6-dideoxygalactose transaminase